MNFCHLKILKLKHAIITRYCKVNFRFIQFNIIVVGADIFNCCSPVIPIQQSHLSIACEER